MKKLVIIITQENASGTITTRDFVGDKELLTNELEWCLDELRNDVKSRRACKINKII
jgi:hypothetical protein